MGNANYQNRIVVDLTGPWNLFLDVQGDITVEELIANREGININVPNVINNYDFGANYVGPFWYYRELTLPADSELFEFFLEGFYGQIQVYIDKTLIGTRTHGYTPLSLYFRIKNKSRSVPHSLAIRLDNRPPPDQTFQQPVFTSYGGLHRNVQLIALSPTFIEQAKFKSKLDPTTVEPENPMTAKAEITCNVQLLSTEPHSNPQTLQLALNMQRRTGSLTKLCNEKPLKTSFWTQGIGHSQSNFKPIALNFQGILPNNEETVEAIDLDSRQTFSLYRYYYQFGTTATCDLWDLDHPVLYGLSIQLLQPSRDNIRYDVGVRQITTNKKGQLLLNYRPVRILGTSRHDDHPEFGPVFNAAYLEHDLWIMKEAGFTGFRPAHYPAADYLLQVADRLGLMIIEEVPNYIMQPAMMKDPVILARGQSMLKEMIHAHFNHPSIVSWSIANECKSDLPESKAMLRGLVKIAHNIDPDRLVHFTGYPGIINIAETNADLVAINVYYGDSVSGKKVGPEVLGDVVDNLRVSMEDPDIGMTNVPLIITEFGSQTVGGYHDIHPYHGKNGASTPFTVYTEERQAYVIESFIDQIKHREFIGGLLVWVWRDNRYEPEIAQSSAGEIMRYGLLDWEGKPKLAFHIFSRLCKELTKKPK